MRKSSCSKLHCQDSFNLILFSQPGGLDFRRGGVPRAVLRQAHTVNHPVVELRANLKSISHRCQLFDVAFVWELTKETIHLPLGCLQGENPDPQILNQVILTIDRAACHGLSLDKLRFILRSFWQSSLLHECFTITGNGYSV